MKSLPRAQFLAGAIIIFLVIAGAGTAWAQAPLFTTTQVVIDTGEERHRIEAEFAVTEEQKSYGLSNRKTMTPDTAMLFDFRRTGLYGMWMKDTYESLDMVFIDDAGTVLGVIPNTKPLSEKILRPPGDVAAVLELVAGRAKALGIEKGDTIKHPIFNRN